MFVSIFWVAWITLADKLKDHIRNHPNSPLKRIILFAGAMIGWTAILLQLYLILQNRETSIPETVVRFFSFYTIFTNILVACCFTILLSKPSSQLGQFFSRPKNFTAIAVYISIAGIVYNVIKISVGAARVTARRWRIASCSYPAASYTILVVVCK